eukprot:371369-Rhodomonas_salina.2
MWVFIPLRSDVESNACDPQDSSERHAREAAWVAGQLGPRRHGQPHVKAIQEVFFSVLGPTPIAERIA